MCEAGRWVTDRDIAQLRANGCTLANGCELRVLKSKAQVEAETAELYRAINNEVYTWDAAP
jgi:hypothetical protein